MGSLIRLATPTPASANSARTFYAPGRALTAADFALQDRYVDDRLLGLTPAVSGVIAGLDVSLDSATNTLTVGMGYGVGADGRVVRVSAPISVTWSQLVDAVTAGGALDDGAYLLLARTVTYDGLDGPPPDPALRGDPDPLLDIRQDSFAEIWLSPSLGAAPTPLTPATLSLALNNLVGAMTASSLAAAAGAGVPLAVVLQQTQAGSPVITLSEAAGRLPAAPGALNAMLMAQVREAIAAAMAEPGADPGSSAWQTSLSQRFRYLPPAGELPVGMLLDATACPFFPAGFEIYLQFIRASQAPQLLTQALSRPVIDLAGNNAESITLALAVPDGAWSPDLIDLPRGDPVLAADLHLAYAQARAKQVAAREAWIALYGGIDATIAAQPQALGLLMDADTASQGVFALLSAGQIAASDILATADATSTPGALVGWLGGLIPSLPAVGVTPPTPTAAQAAQSFASLGYQEADPEPAQADPTVDPSAPIASDVLLAPLLPALPPNSAFADWTAAIQAVPPDPQLLQPLIDAGVFEASADDPTRLAAITALLALPAPTGGGPNDDTQPGALLNLALLQMFYAVLLRVTQAQEHRLDSHGRMIALQRQHLDIMSTYISALAGGTPSDGTGLSFTRIIPFFQLDPDPPAATSAASNLRTERVLSAAATPRGATAMRATRSARFVASQVGTVSSALSGARFTSSQAGSVSAALRGALGSQAASAVASSNLAPSFIDTIGSAVVSHVSPIASIIGSRIGTSDDVARQVASETEGLTQAPPFTYQPVEYGTAAHITTGATLLQIANTGLTGLRGLMQQTLSLTPTAQTTGAAPSDTDSETANYAAIIASTRDLLGDMAQVETSAIAVESAYFQFRDRLQSIETRIGQLTAAVADARDALRNALGDNAQAAGDYAAAQRLVAEETARVAAATDARSQAIAAATGLFFERELQTYDGRDLPPALILTADTPTDLVPGCPADHAGPPASLQPFLGLLLEAPLNDWRPLTGGWVGLPDQAGLQRIGVVRTARLASWTMPSYFGASAAAGDLASLAQTTRDAFTPLFNSVITSDASLAVTQQAAFSVLSLPDIVSLPVSQLRTDSEALRARLESATGCLFETLTAAPPSTRFAWASLARAKTLPLLNFSQWPLPAGVDGATSTTLRRLGALVDWISGQLQQASSAAGQTALANLVAAAVMAAAYGDPSEAVTGTVATSGAAPRPGTPIRVILNRPPPIGTLLQLLDENQAVVGTIRVADHDNVGTTATVVTSFGQSAPTSGWTVASLTSRTAWLPT